MKRILKSNQIAITSLAIMIAVAGYLNFTRSEAPSTAGKTAAKESLDTIDTMDISDGDALISEKVDDDLPVKETETIGDAVLTQAEVGEYVAGAKMEREQAHSKTKDSLNEIIENEAVQEKDKQRYGSQTDPPDGYYRKGSGYRAVTGYQGL